MNAANIHDPERTPDLEVQNQDTTATPAVTVTRGVERLLGNIDELNGAITVQAGEAADSLDRVVNYDARMDADIRESKRLSVVGGRESRERGCGCHAVFSAIGHRLTRVEAVEVLEDQAVAASAGHVGVVRERSRSIAGRIERTLTGRRVRPSRSRRTREASCR